MEKAIKVLIEVDPTEDIDHEEENIIDQFKTLTGYQENPNVKDTDNLLIELAKANAIPFETIKSFNTHIRTVIQPAFEKFLSQVEHNENPPENISQEQLEKILKVHADMILHYKSGHSQQYWDTFAELTPVDMHNDL